MPKNILHSTQNGTDNTYTGKLQINVTSSLGLIPIQDATITISYTGVPDVTIEKISTDSSGQTEMVDLPAPPPEYSLNPVEQQPYSEYNIQVEAPGYEPVMVSGTEILPGVTAMQPVELTPIEATQQEEEVIVIPDHTLYGEYPPKIPEEEIKPVDESGEIVLSRVVIPEYVVVSYKIVLLLNQKIKPAKLMGFRVYVDTFDFVVPESSLVFLIQPFIGSLPVAGECIEKRLAGPFVRTLCQVIQFPDLF